VEAVVVTMITNIPVFTIPIIAKTTAEIEDEGLHLHHPILSQNMMNLVDDYLPPTHRNEVDIVIVTIVIGFAILRIILVTILAIIVATMVRTE
jgi:hypothetical protein